MCNKKLKIKLFCKKPRQKAKSKGFSTISKDTLRLVQIWPSLIEQFDPQPSNLNIDRYDHHGSR